MIRYTTDRARPGSVAFHDEETERVYNYNSGSRKEDLWKLEVFHMRSQRMILGIRWHDFVRNTQVVDRTGLPCFGMSSPGDETHCSAMW